MNVYFTVVVSALARQLGYPSGPRNGGLSWFSKAIPDVRVCPISAKILGRQNAHMYISKR